MKRLILANLTGILILLATCSNATAQSSSAEGIKWYSLEQAQEQALKRDKKVLIYAEATWCGYCRKMDREVFPASEVINTMEKYYFPVRLDIESDRKIMFNGTEMTERQFAREYRVTGTPTTFFVNREGQILGAQPGFIPAEIFATLLTYVGTEAYTQVEFDQYMKDHQ